MSKCTQSNLPLNTIVLGVLFFVLNFFSPQNIQAASIATGSAVVSATVPDNAGPTTPILIAPANNSMVTDGTPTFTWEASTDANGIDKYMLSLDGSTLIDSIPTTATDNLVYTLTYDNILGRYSLTPKTVIADGAHTWKIRAVDTLNNGTDSATWNFTMDTQAPIFVVTNLGALGVSISAQDISTIPGTPLELADNEPLVIATSESNSSVTVTLTIPSNPTQNFSTTVDGSGNWSLQLGILPRDVTLLLNFTITDLAGNVSILNGVPFVIKSTIFVFPPTSPSPSPSPSASANTSPEPSPSPTAVLPSPSPLISIPILPPREIAYSVGQQVVNTLPESFSQLASALPQEVIQVIENAAPVSALLVSAALPTATAVAIGSQFGGGISFDLIIKLLQALGLIPSGKPQGLVFNSKTYEPVPFALLTISNPGSQKAPVVETVVTDVFGVYRGVKLPPDTYQISVSHQDFRFPSVLKRNELVKLADFYLGEPFEVTSNETEQLFLIPADPINPSGRLSVKTEMRIFLAQFGKLTGVLVMPLFLASGFLAILFPSIWNNGIFALYSIMVGYKGWSWFKVPIITGIVTDPEGNPIENAVVRLSVSETNQLATVMSTSKKGEFIIYGTREKYQLSVTKPGLVWLNQQSVLSYYEVDTTQQNQNVVVTLSPLTQIYGNLFQ